MTPFSRSEAESFFGKIVEGVDGESASTAAFEGDRVVGTVQIVPATPPNQPHRADIAKLLVHRSARGQGVGYQLMQSVEEVSREVGKTLLVLDTATGDAAERLYVRLGWTKVGVIPKYALYPNGSWCTTTLFWKELV